MPLDKVRNLVRQAQDAASSGNLWRAYVAVEHAILDIKLRYGLEHEQAPPAVKRTAKKDDLVEKARSMLGQTEVEGDKKKLLYDLRSCRDALKAALAKS